MPKMKTHSSAKKRFKVTGKKKLKHRHANTSHRMRNRSKKQKSRLSLPGIVSKADEKRVKRQLCIGG